MNMPKGTPSVLQMRLSVPLTFGYSLLYIVFLTVIVGGKFYVHTRMSQYMYKAVAIEDLIILHVLCLVHLLQHIPDASLSQLLKFSYAGSMKCAWPL